MSDADRNWAEAAEARVLRAAVALAPSLGWSRRLIETAAAEAGLSPADAALLMPQGPRDLAALLSRQHDRDALAALAEVDPMSLKVRERIRRAVEARVEAAAAEAEAVKRCLGFLAFPANLALGARLLWESADVLWRWAGDTATDENHYTKRAILSGILATTVATRFDRGANAAADHLAGRIDQVMAFEKWKANLPRPSEGLSALAGRLARRRYGPAEAPVNPADPSAAAID